MWLRFSTFYLLGFFPHFPQRSAPSLGCCSWNLNQNQAQNSASGAGTGSPHAASSYLEPVTQIRRRLTGTAAPPRWTEGQYFPQCPGSHRLNFNLAALCVPGLICGWMRLCWCTCVRAPFRGRHYEALGLHLIPSIILTHKQTISSH